MENEQIKSLIDDVAKYWEYANEEDLEGITVSKNGGFTIGNFTVSSGQGGVVAIWDDQGEMVHISKAEFGIVSTLFDGYVYTLCGVMYWGHPLSYAMAKSPFGVMDAWKEADEFLTQRGLFFITPSGYPQQFPQVAIAQNYAKLMNKCAEQLGLTPSARSRIIAENMGGPADDMEDLLGGG